MSRTKVIQPASLHFLKNLSKNNNRDWFNDNKENYLKAKLNIEEFVDQLISRMTQHDQIETLSGKKSLYRIYNDVRFSKSKDPYNPRFAGYLKRAKPLLRGGYYFWIGPGISRVACGFGYPNPDDLKRVREDIDCNYEDWTKLLRNKSIRTTFGAMKGEQVKTTPKGYKSDHPAIELLRFKQFWFECSFTDKEVVSANFLTTVNTTFKNIRPFFDYMSDVLTTDLNGESAID
jgi:uncharacterized protein (TIGR02453 family)